LTKQKLLKKKHSIKKVFDVNNPKLAKMTDIHLEKKSIKQLTEKLL